MKQHRGGARPKQREQIASNQASLLMLPRVNLLSAATSACKTLTPYLLKIRDPQIKVAGQ